MVNIDRYLSSIRPHVKGCPDASIREHLILVLRDICQRANLWRHRDILYMVQGISEYELDSPSGADVATVQVIRDSAGQPLSNQPFPAFLTAGAPRYYQHHERGVIIVGPEPGADGIYDYETTLMPSLDATEIPETVYAETAEFAGWGVLAHLYMIKDAPWSDNAMGEYNRGRFEKTLHRKRISNLTGISGSDHTVKRKRFV